MGNLNRLTIIIFMALLYIPLTIMVLTPDQETSFFENRPLAQAPDPQTLTHQPLKEIFDAIETYVSDQFGLREVLAWMQGAYYYNVFDSSPTDSVLIGEDDWLFYASSASEYSIEDYRGLVHLPKDYLREAAHYLQSRKDWLNARGIDYVFVIAPDKHTLYPEFVPEQFTVLNRERRIDQFLAYVREHTDVDILDLRQPVLEAKKAGTQVFYHYDTHWTAAGALVGYQALMEHLNITPIGDWTPVPGERVGDLGKLMGLHMVEATTDYQYAAGCAVEQGETLPISFPYWVEMHDFGCSTASQRALIFHDSFGDVMRPFVAEHFSRSVFVKARYAEELVEPLVDYLQPGVVIEQIVERRLNSYFDYSPESTVFAYHLRARPKDAVEPAGE